MVVTGASHLNKLANKFILLFFILLVFVTFHVDAHSLHPVLYERIHHAVIRYEGGIGKFTTGLEREIRQRKEWNESIIQHFVKLLYRTGHCQQVLAYLDQYPSPDTPGKDKRLVFLCREIPWVEKIDIVFKGSHTYSGRRILRALGIPSRRFPIHYMNKEKWTTSLNQFYRLAGFDPPEMSFNLIPLNASRTKYKLVITLREGLPHRIRFRTYPVHLCSQLRQDIEKKIRSFKRFEFQIRKLVDEAIERFRATGYPLARVHFQYDKANEVLEFTGECGPKILLVIQGWPEGKPPSIDLRNFFRPDEGWNVERLDEVRAFLQTELERLGYRDAEIRYRVGPPATPQFKRIFFMVKPGPYYLLQSVSFEGLPTIVLRRIEKNLRLPIRWNSYVLENMKALILSHMRTYGFEHVDCQSSFSLKAVRVFAEFRCSYRPPVTIENIEFFGNVAFSDAELLEKLPIKKGDIFRPDTIAQAMQILQNFYWRQGFFHVHIDHIVNQIDEISVNIQFRILEGERILFGHIVYMGFDRTKPWVMEKIVKIQPGQPFSLDELERIQNTMYNLGIFSRVDIRVPVPEYMEPHQDLVLEVEEAQPFHYSIGIGYQERDKVRGIFSFTHRNVLGQALMVTGLLRVSFVNRRALLSLGSPFFFSKLLDWRFSAETEFQDRVTFDLRRDRLLFQLFRSYRRQTSYVFQIEFSKTKVQNISLESQNLILIAREFENLRLTKLSGLYIRDYRNDPLFPTQGSFTSVQTEVSIKALGSDVNFIKMEGTYVRYFQWKQRFIFAFALRTGWGRRFGKSPILPISQRFFEGGSRSHRGFSLDELGPKDPVNQIPTGGNAFWIMNLEERIRLHKDWSSVFFLDIGNVFRENLSFDPSLIRKAIGVGIRYHALFGIIGADLAYLLDAQPNEARWHFFLTVGQAF